MDKPRGDGAWINGGFFMLSPRVVDCITGDATVCKDEPLRALAREGQLSSYPRDGFGSGWTRCATARLWRACGEPVAPLGARGFRRRRVTGVLG